MLYLRMAQNPFMTQQHLILCATSSLFVFRCTVSPIGTCIFDVRLLNNYHQIYSKLNEIIVQQVRGRGLQS